MAGRLIVVKAAYDAEAGVWYVEDSDLPGVNAWAPTVQELSDKLPAVVLDLLEDEGGDSGRRADRDHRAHEHACAARHRRLKDDGKPLRKILTEAGSRFVRQQGRGDHEIWTSPHRPKPFTVPSRSRPATWRSRSKDAGLPKAF